MAQPVPQPVRGTHDLIGEAFRRHHEVIRTARRVAGLYGCEEWATPIFEATSVFARSLGDTSDVVSKEMYSFEDRGGDSLTLRPENTAGICRALVSNGLAQANLPRKVFYAGPMFRYERPQKGRYRQFHQIGVEILGAAEPLADAEAIACGWQLLNALELADGVVLELNTLGDAASRAAWRAALVELFTAEAERLSPESRERLARNPLRILDSKAPADRAVAAAAPPIDGFLSAEARRFYDSVKRHLDGFGVPWRENPAIVRGLDYYNHTAFEFVTDRLGAQGTVLAGGRYDGLVEQLGGPPTPGVGWAAGVERLAMLLEATEPPDPPVAIIPVGEAAEAAALALATELRLAHVPVELAYRGTPKRRMERANRLNAIAAIILGDRELAEGTVQLKDLDSGTQASVPRDALLPALAELGVEGAMVDAMAAQMDQMLREPE
jgi:histidyl-tRNA synthetase